MKKVQKTLIIYPFKTIRKDIIPFYIFIPYKMIYKKKWWFWWSFSMLWSVAYMLYSWDFYIELTAKYRKTYNWEFWYSYSDIVEKNIEKQNIENLQITYCWKEWWKHKAKNLLNLWFSLKNKYTKEELKNIYNIEHNKKYTIK